MHRGVRGGVQRGAWRCVEVCRGVHGGVHRGVHGGATRDAPRCAEVHGGVCRGVRRGVQGFDWITSSVYLCVFHLNILSKESQYF